MFLLLSYVQCSFCYSFDSYVFEKLRAVLFIKTNCKLANVIGFNHVKCIMTKVNYCYALTEEFSSAFKSVHSRQIVTWVLIRLCIS